MNSSRIIIKIRMTQRIASDSPDIIITVEEGFQNEELDINISKSPIETTDETVTREASETARQTLDLQNQAVKEGMAEIKSLEEAKKETHRWLQTLRHEGVRAVAQAVVRELVSRAADFFL